jgi:predicted TIM-barrel fold metal-dependent hydrolase
MAENGVARAFVVAAAIGGEDARTQNLHNNDDVAQLVREHPTTFRMFADVDSRWSPSYHRPGSATRLAQAIERTGAAGFTHYLGDADDGWFDTTDAAEFFTTAESLGLVASVHAPPAWHAAIGALAERHPDLTLLLHHQGLATTDEEVEALIALATHPRIAVKVSGFRYVSTTTAPYADVRVRLGRVARAFGAERLAWGSDWPVSTQHHSYADALAFARDALAFFDASERERVFGGTILSLSPWRS